MVRFIFLATGGGRVCPVEAKVPVLDSMCRALLMFVITIRCGFQVETLNSLLNLRGYLYKFSSASTLKYLYDNPSQLCHEAIRSYKVLKWITYCFLANSTIQRYRFDLMYNYKIICKSVTVELYLLSI